MTIQKEVPTHEKPVPLSWSMSAASIEEVDSLVDLYGHQKVITPFLSESSMFHKNNKKRDTQIIGRGAILNRCHHD